MSVDRATKKRNTIVLLLCLAAAAVVIVVVLAVGIFIMMPLIYPSQLPQDKMATLLTAPPPPPPPPPPALSSPRAPAKILIGRPVVQSPAHPKRVVLPAGVAQGLLIMKTNPVYPPIAKAARVSGTVVLQAVISTSGSIENLRVISGPAMLQQSALDAVKTWRYRPYLLNNQPVEVETTINVIYTLGN
jgi:protein TonB